jgi:hypothetical protein
MLPEHDCEVLTMMTLKRFRALTRSYGAQLQRWPQEERGTARELLDSSEAARALLEQERSLDAAIAAAGAQQDAKHGTHGAENAALARLRSAVAARIATRQAYDEPPGRLGWLLGPAGHTSSVRMRRIGLATSGAFAIIAGLLIGAIYSPAPAPVGALSALLQPATLDILAD